MLRGYTLWYLPPIASTLALPLLLPLQLTRIHSSGSLAIYESYGLPLVVSKFMAAPWVPFSISRGSLPNYVCKR